MPICLTLSRIKDRTFMIEKMLKRLIIIMDMRLLKPEKVQCVKISQASLISKYNWDKFFIFSTSLYLVLFNIFIKTKSLKSLLKLYLKSLISLFYKVYFPLLK